MEGAADDLSGYAVEATDGRVGTVAAADDGAIVLSPDPAFFAKKLILPADAVERVDVGARTVYVARSKDEVKDAPQVDDDLGAEESAEATPYYDHELAPFTDDGAGYSDPVPPEP
jgi:hypothetical protein